jgi:hypothetical protein
MRSRQWAGRAEARLYPSIGPGAGRERMSRPAPDRAWRYDGAPCPRTPRPETLSTIHRCAADAPSRSIEGLEPAPGDLLAPVPDTAVIEASHVILGQPGAGATSGDFGGYLSPDQAMHAMRRAPLHSRREASPARAHVDVRGFIGVWPGFDGLQVWGTTLSVRVAASCRERGAGAAGRQAPSRRRVSLRQRRRAGR